MSTRIARFALGAAFLVALVPRPAAAAPAITRGQFIEAYVDCNNAVWKGVSRGMISTSAPPTMSDKMRGIDSARVRGFAGESLYFEGVYGNVQPRAAATVGWALATKAFADRGDIEPRFRARAAAVAYLRERGMAGVAALGDGEAGAIATELELSARGWRYAITPIPAGTRLTGLLDRVAARAMFAKIGTHFDVGSARTLPQPGRACPPRVRATLFR